MKTLLGPAVPALALLLSACASAPAADREAGIAALMRTDTEFSRMSQERGTAAAFAAYVAADGIVLAEYPARRGVAAVEAQFSAAPPGSRLTWKPSIADVSASGDLGYTVGTYELRSPGGLARTGKYMTVWKKQPDGSWKFAADGGTPDPPPAQPRPAPTPGP